MAFVYKRKNKKSYVCAAVVPAAGSSRRTKGIDKLFYQLCGKEILMHTIEKLEKSEKISEIVIVTREDMIEEVSHLCEKYCVTKVSKVIQGGETRLDSVLEGVRSLSKNVEYVAVHDAARPFISGKVICEAIEAAVKMGAAAPAVPVKDTIKRARNDIVVETPQRDELFAVQTPQVFDRDLLLAALSNAVEKNIPVTDDCSAVEAIGMSVFLTEGDYRNIKITTPDDFIYANAIINRDLEGESF